MIFSGLFSVFATRLNSHNHILSFTFQHVCFNIEIRSFRCYRIMNGQYQFQRIVDRFDFRVA